MIPARYARQLPILTEAGQRRLAEKRVLIVGCGGLGGHLAEHMVRLGVGHIRAVDPDVFEESNLNRQLLSTTPLLGASKAQAAAARARAIDPNVDFEAVPEAFTAENGDRLLGGCDLVLDGLDSVRDRLLLEAACARHDLPLVHGAVAGELVEAAVSPPGSGLLKTLYEGAPEPAMKATLAYAPACCAAIQSAQALRLLLGEEPPLWGKVLQLDLGDMTQTIFPLL